jgi:2-polyprenyl-6-methoxyphenol hydroxylase-like FAD-dependent oxidoreductase
VLVVGAGPTGLAVALYAHAHGARVRLVESRTEVRRPSRAMIVHPRTLEVLRPLGVTDALIGVGQVSPTVALHTGHRVVKVSLGSLRLPDTSFPYLLFLRQSDLESVLTDAAAARGIVVERGTEFRGYRVRDSLPVVQLRHTTGVEEAVCRYVVGCDGASSAVRRAAHVDFVGAPYAVDIVLADVELHPDPGDAMTHAVVAKQGLTLLFPLGERATWRLLASVPSEPSNEPFGAFGAPMSHTALSQVVRPERRLVEPRPAAAPSRFAVSTGSGPARR